MTNHNVESAQYIFSITFIIGCLQPVHEKKLETYVLCEEAMK